MRRGVETGRERGRAPGSARMCVGCGARVERDELLRLVLAGDPPRLVPDVRRRAAGRGASVHLRRACLARALGSGRFGKRRIEPSDDVDGTIALAREQYRRTLDGLVLAAKRSQGVAVGTDATREVLARGRAATVVFARDAAGDRERLGAGAEARGVPVVVAGTKLELGRLWGRSEIGVLAVTNPRIGTEVAHVATCMERLSEEA